MSVSIRFFSWRSKNEFEITVVNEPSVFEPLKFYCKCFSGNSIFKTASSPLENVSYNTMMFSAMNPLKKTGQPAMDSLPLATWRMSLCRRISFFSPLFTSWKQHLLLSGLAFKSTKFSD